MAKYFLLNPVLVAAGRLLWPGTLVDDAQENLAAISAKGGRLYPSSNATVAAGAVEAERVKRSGGTVEQAAAVMSQAAAAADAASAGGGAFVMRESIPLNYGYTAGQSAPIGDGATGASAVDVGFEIVDPFFAFQPFVPMVVLGASAAVIDDSPDPLTLDGNGVSLGKSVTFTLAGVDIAGAELVATLTVSKRGAFSFKRGFRSLTRLTSDVAPGIGVQLYTAKGFVTSNPFDPATLGVSVIFPLAADVLFVHGPSGAIVPDAAWNVSENIAYVTYRVARGGS